MESVPRFESMLREVAVDKYRPFLHMYVVWHPDFQAGSSNGLLIAEKLYREFSRDPEKPMSPALGIPTYFRTSTVQGIAPPRIDLNAAQFSVIVLLIDSSMVLDSAYQKYATELAERIDNQRHRILCFTRPRSGFLNVGNIQQVVLKCNESEMETELRMKLASETCRLLQNRHRSGASNGVSPQPPMLFISHAKRDAEEQADELKALVEKTSIDTFFDRVHIAAGFDFTREILENIKRSTVLVWQSDEYGSRPWCNIELLTAKEAMRPIVVVLGVKSGEERSFPYLGNVRTIVATETNSSEIIIAAVREYLRKLYVEGRFESLSLGEMVPTTRFSLFRPPEPIDGALIERKSRDNTGVAERAAQDEPEPVMYPDPPVSTIECDVLKRLFPEIRFITPTTVDPHSLSGLRVALSISEPDDVSYSGQSRLHLLSLMLELAPHILSRGGIIAYGGDLRPVREGGFTRQLFQLVYAYKDLSRPPLERIWNFLAHHVAAELPKEDEAVLLQLATFEKSLPSKLARRFDLRPRKPVPDDNEEHRYIRAQCLTAMREEMLEKTDARIVVGGRTSRHQGKYPGILEEAGLSLGRKPLYIIGAFGGCASSIVRALRDKESPEAFTREYQVKHPRTAKWISSDGTESQETVSLEQLEHSYHLHKDDPEIGQEPINYPGLLEQFHHAKIGDVKNGLTDIESLELFEIPDLDRIISLVVKGLSNLQLSHGTNQQEKS